MSLLPQLSIDHCRARQQRLREMLTTMRADRAFLVAAENVQWLTGFRPHPLMRAVAVLEVDSTIDCPIWTHKFVPAVGVDSFIRWGFDLPRADGRATRFGHAERDRSLEPQTSPWQS